MRGAVAVQEKRDLLSTAPPTIRRKEARPEVSGNVSQAERDCVVLQNENTFRSRTSGGQEEKGRHWEVRKSKEERLGGGSEPNLAREIREGEEVQATRLRGQWRWMYF